MEKMLKQSFRLFTDWWPHYGRWNTASFLSLEGNPLHHLISQDKEQLTFTLNMADKIQVLILIKSFKSLKHTHKNKYIKREINDSAATSRHYMKF